MSEWCTKRLGEVADIQIGGTPSREIARYWASTNGEGEYWVSIADLKARVIEETKERITAEGVLSSNVKRVPSGTLIMSFKLSIGRAAIAGRDLYTNEAIAAIIPRADTVSSDYLYYVLPPIAKNAITDTAVKGSTLNKKSLSNLSLTYPRSHLRQVRIASILQTVDQAIEKTEALIEKYGQIKAGMMHDLFTRGLTPDGKLRPPRDQAPELYKKTPIGWIPKEWGQPILQDLCGSLITYGIVQAGPHIDGGVPYIRTGDMSGDLLSVDKMLRTSAIIANSFKRSEVRSGEIVCAIRATVGKALVVPAELDGANLTQGTARISPYDDVENSFVYWGFRSEAVQKSIQLAIKGTTFNEITLGDLRKIPFSVPHSAIEQRLIAEKLDECDGLIASEKSNLEKLRLQKSGLMHDLLTGKVAVKVDEPEVAHV